MDNEAGCPPGNCPMFDAYDPSLGTRRLKGISSRVGADFNALAIADQGEEEHRGGAALSHSIIVQSAGLT